MHHMRDAASLHHVSQPCAIEDRTKLDINFVDDIADQRFVAMASVDNGPVSFADELAARFGADDAHSAGD